MNNTIKASLIVGTLTVIMAFGLFLIGPAMIGVAFGITFLCVVTWAVKEELDMRERRKERAANRGRW